tara:strand:- start:197 stop:607 length:411 start_codon:yes stop_codon:yes gene_type:complete
MSQDRISTEQQAVDKQKFDNNFEDIFGKHAKAKGSGGYVQCSETGKLIPKGQATVTARVSADFIKPHQEFVSPIDGKVISSRKQLAEHNKRHGVTNSADYAGGYVERQAVKRVTEGQRYLKETRRKDINEAISRHS